AAGEHRNATAAAISAGSAKRRIGISDSISCCMAAVSTPDFCARVCTICSMRGVLVEPGSTLLTVMPNGASSVASVLDQLATAQRVVLETPSPAMGSFTEVEMMLTM